MTRFGTATGHVTGGLNFRVEVEEGVQAHAQLGLDLITAPFQHVHCDVRFVAVFQLDGRLSDRRYLVGR